MTNNDSRRRNDELRDLLLKHPSFLVQSPAAPWRSEGAFAHFVNVFHLVQALAAIDTNESHAPNENRQQKGIIITQESATQHSKENR
jgi:hypothetical protein